MKMKVPLKHKRVFLDPIFLQQIFQAVHENYSSAYECQSSRDRLSPYSTQDSFYHLEVSWHN